MKYINYKITIMLEAMLIRLCSKLVAKDKFGNEFYTSKQKDYLGREKRYVIYATDVPEATSIEAKWHRWLQYISKEMPSDERDLYEWQIDRVKNATGTKNAYVSSNTNVRRMYEAWRP